MLARLNITTPEELLNKSFGLSLSDQYWYGQELNIIDYDNDELAIAGEGKFFYNVEKFENIISVVKNIKRIDISKLDGIVEEYDKLLHEYQNITNLSDKKISALCVLLKRQIIFDKIQLYVIINFRSVIRME